MFTGIVETTGILTEITATGNNRSFRIESEISRQLKADQSVNHNGVCLTVEEVTGNFHTVTAVDETLKKTNLGNWQPGDIINLERCLRLESRLDGHLVQGHADTTAACAYKKEKKGSWEFEFSFAKPFGALIIEKGSVCVNGISLTAFDVKKKSFSVAIIPYTFLHTNMQWVKKGDLVNIEFDMIGKYIQRLYKTRK